MDQHIQAKSLSYMQEDRPALLDVSMAAVNASSLMDDEHSLRLEGSIQAGLPDWQQRPPQKAVPLFRLMFAERGEESAREVQVSKRRCWK